jgi:colanic acid biosynthesis glycosyl transferase WcaI
LRILVIGLNYAPDLIGIAKYTAELCEDLASRGHTVEIITAPPYYPMWRVSKDYRAGRRDRETLNGVTVRRVRTYVPSQPSGVRRLIHLASFAIAALPLACHRARKLRPDLVLAIAPAFFSAPVALLAAQAAKAQSWLHIQDFELDAAFELGILKGNRTRRVGLRIERAVLRRFDKISTISPRMVDQLLAKGVAPDATLEIRNWVDINQIKPWPSTNTEYRRELGISVDMQVLLYSGNMGAKQGLDVVAYAARVFRERGHMAVFLLVGNGPFRPQLEASCEGLENVLFMDLQPAERMAELLATADIHLLPQRREAADLVLPSKLALMLASGRPSVVMAAAGTSLATEVAGAGTVVEPDDLEGWVAALENLAKHPDYQTALGLQARHRAETHWNRTSIMDKFEAELSRLECHNKLQRPI